MRTVGNYEITGLLGRGGMAEVYAVRRLGTERQFACKVIKGAYAQQMGRSEAAVLKRLKSGGLFGVHGGLWRLRRRNRHPVPAFEESFSWGNAYCIVMEQCQGRTLEQLLLQESALEEEEVLLLGIRLSSLLRWMHRGKRRVLYLDLKPANILMKEKQLNALVDFGCAGVLGRGKTLSADGLGTVGYAAPEQFQKGEALTVRTDIYGLGRTLKAAAGKGTLSRSLSLLLEQCTRAEPSDRPGSMREVRRRLTGCLLSAKMKKWKAACRRGRVAAAVWVLSLLLAAGGLGIFGWSQSLAGWEAKINRLTETPFDAVQGEQLEQYLNERVFFHVTRRAVLSCAGKRGGRILFRMGKGYWYRGAGEKDQKKGSRLCREALELGGLDGRMSREAQYLAKLENKTAKSLFGLFQFLEEEDNRASDLLRVGKELIQQLYFLEDSRVGSGENKQRMLLEAEDYFTKNRELFSGKEQEELLTLLEVLEELLAEKEGENV
ncbi:MAG: protein kinase [Lachnospiraceae bacterium]|nr:protein kinase [Lachnospiraceae bacterium]MDD7023362.1 protein kinase [Oscillospiraceae bacterium]MDY5541183.1 protein kinase [Lachnospiraceae bacterium]